MKTKTLNNIKDNRGTLEKTLEDINTNNGSKDLTNFVNHNIEFSEISLLDCDRIISLAYKHQEDVKREKVDKLIQESIDEISKLDNQNLELVKRFFNYSKYISNYVEQTKEILVFDNDTESVHKIIKLDSRVYNDNHCLVFLADEKYLLNASDVVKDQFVKDMEHMISMYRLYNPEITVGLKEFTNGRYTKFNITNYQGLWYFYFRISKKELLRCNINSMTSKFRSLREFISKPLRRVKRVIQR